MKRLLIGLVLSLVATVASAGWVLVTTGENGVKYYFDPATKKRSGNLVRIWGITENGKPISVANKVFRSDRNYWQYDCAARTSQYLEANLFAGKMATGELVASINKPGNKRFVAPDTVDEDLLNFVCK